MRKVILCSLATVLLIVAWVPECAAFWWRRRARCGGPQGGFYVQPAPMVGYAPYGYAPYAPAAPYPYAPYAPAAPVPSAVPHTVAPQAVPQGVAPPRQFRSPKGRIYQVIPTGERGESEELELRLAVPSAAHVPNDGEHFAGKARKAAKTSFAQAASVESFASPGALLDSILQGQSPVPNDMMMRTRLGPSSARAPEEQRNVTVTAFLYATKKEADNDFHLLIGSDPNGGDGRFMTAEVSGLPNPDDSLTPQFQRVRDQFKSFFENGSPGNSALPGDRYLRFDPPIPVTVTGSVFFDVDHRIGEVHSGNIVPESVWEIHPIRDLVFEP